VADEFVDLYETLDLPMDSDRNTVRKRINELYIEAQRNLDHRNFQTRIKYQELFEITLPQARYILLDEGRRDQYDALVRSTRAPKGQTAGASAGPTPTPSTPQSGFQLEDSIPGQSPVIEPIPSSNVPEITPEERDAQWQKWKSGLAEVLERESTDEIRQKTKPAISASTSTNTEPATKKESKARPVIKFDFGEEEDHEGGFEGSSDEAKLNKKEVEQRRTDHRRDLMKDILVGEGIKGMAIGAAMVAIPGVIAMITFMSHFYPRGKAAGLPVPEGMAWLIWLALLGVAGFFASRGMSKSMKKKRAMDLGKLPYEEIVRISGRSV
jgi:hypothetical protein